MAARAHALGLVLLPVHSGYALAVDGGLTFGPAPWDECVREVAEIEAERAEWTRRQVSGRERWHRR